MTRIIIIIIIIYVHVSRLQYCQIEQLIHVGGGVKGAQNVPNVTFQTDKFFNKIIISEVRIFVQSKTSSDYFLNKEVRQQCLIRFSLNLLGLKTHF